MRALAALALGACVAGCVRLPPPAWSYAASAPTVGADDALWLTVVRSGAGASDRVFLVRCREDQPLDRCEWRTLREQAEGAVSGADHTASSTIESCVAEARRPVVVHATVNEAGGLDRPELSSEATTEEGTCLARALESYRAGPRLARGVRIELRFPSAQTE